MHLVLLAVSLDRAGSPQPLGLGRASPTGRLLLKPRDARVDVDVTTAALRSPEIAASQRSFDAGAAAEEQDGGSYIPTGTS
jgi:hypothetical protein